MNYLTSYLVCQLREAKVVTLKNTEVAVVFMLRNISAITSSINRLVPPYALDQVVVSLPESKEFILLNGSELEGSDVFTKFQDYAYLPSGLIEILPKPFEFNPPSSNKSWPEFWKHICSKTTDISRRSYCASFASSSPSNDDAEENLKTVLNISELNKVALLNLLKSGKVMNCVSREDIRNYSLRPRPDNEESAISTAAESGDRVILPGQCSYILMWKGRRSIYRRNYNLEPRAENRQFYNNKQATSISTNYLCEADLLTLASNDRNKTIDDAPVGIIEIAPKKISSIENVVTKDITLASWINVDLWNPFYSISRITNNKILKVWNKLYEATLTRLENKLSRRGDRLHNNMELVSLMVEMNGRSVPRTRDFKNIVLDRGHSDNDEHIGWINSLINIMNKLIESQQADHSNFLLNQLARGASCFSVIQNVARMENSIPFNWCPVSGDNSSFKNEKLERIYWIIQNLRVPPSIWP